MGFCDSAWLWRTRDDCAAIRPDRAIPPCHCPFGIDIIYYFHRWAAVAALGLVVGHYILLRLRYPEAIGPANPLVAPWQMTAGRVAFGLFVILVVSSLWRKTFRIDYDRWRVGHAVMAVIGVVLAMAHIWGVGHYTEATWKGTLWGAYTALWVLVGGYVRVVRPWSLLRTPYSVVDVRASGELRGRSLSSQSVITESTSMPGNSRGSPCAPVRSARKNIPSRSRIARRTTARWSLRSRSWGTSRARSKT